MTQRSKTTQLLEKARLRDRKVTGCIDCGHGQGEHQRVDRRGQIAAAAACLECDCKHYLRPVPGANRPLLEVTRAQLYEGYVSAAGLGTMTPNVHRQPFQVFFKVSDDRFLVIAP